MDLPIKKRYIISKNSLVGFRKDVPICVVVEHFSAINKSIREKFSDSDLDKSIAFLPINNNKYSDRNSEKWFTVDKTKPKELYSYDLWCTRYRWAGRGKSKPYMDWFTVSKHRYHRDYFAPYEVNFYYDKDNDCVVSDKIPFNDINFGKIKNTINLVLKIFGECIVTDQDNDYVGRIQLVKWKFLPSGHWSTDKDAILKRVGKGKKSEIENFIHDLEILYSLKPNKVAIGENGFRGYVAFCFNDKGICVLESKFPLNATYVFDLTYWEDLSKKTKTEVIEGKLAKKRVFHYKKWETEIRALLA